MLLPEKELWDRYQTEYRSNYGNKTLLKGIDPLALFIQRYYKNEKAPVNATVVEIGFGNGDLLRSLSKIFTYCYGLDISPRNVEHTGLEFKKEGLGNVVLDVYNVLMPETEKYKGSFDVIVMSHVLEHFDENELRIVLQNLKEIGKRGVLFFGATPYRSHPQFRICPNCGHAFEIDGHKQVLDELGIEKLLSDSGWSLIEARHYNKEYDFYGESWLLMTMRKLMHRLRNINYVTQLEFVAKLAKRVEAEGD